MSCTFWIFRSTAVAELPISNAIAKMYSHCSFRNTAMYRLDSAGTKIANTTRPSLPTMHGSELARTALQPILRVEGLDAQGNQLPSGYAHLCRELFKRLLAEVAAPNLDRAPIRPSQAGRAVLSRGAEEPDNPRAAVCASLALQIGRAHV